MTTIAGVFNDSLSADRAVGELLNAGFAKDDISLLMSDQTRHRLFNRTDDEADRAAKGALAGATVGGAIGAVVAGLTSAGVIISSGGTLLVAGPIVAALSGAGAGAVAGGLAGALIRAGFASDEANRFEEEIKRGKAVVIAHTADDQKASVARATFKILGGAVSAPQAA